MSEFGLVAHPSTYLSKALILKVSILSHVEIHLLLRILLIEIKLFEHLHQFKDFAKMGYIQIEGKYYHFIEFFTVCTKLAEMAILYSKDLTTAKKSYLQWGSTWCKRLLLV